MSDGIYSDDLKVLEDLYRGVKEKKFNKENKAKAEDTFDEDNAAVGLTTAYDVLRDRQNREQTGMDRDMSEVANGLELFDTLETTLEASGRTSNGKLMKPVMDTLNEYMADDGIVVDISRYKELKKNPETKQEDKDKERRSVLADVVVKAYEVMDAFKTAAEKYVTSHEGKTKAWTEAGKQRRALIRASMFQMEDQMQAFLKHSKILEDNIGVMLEKAGEDQTELKFNTHDLCKTLITEQRDKENADEVKLMAKEIVETIAAEEGIRKSDKELTGASAVGKFISDNLNLSDTNDDNILSLDSLYKQYMFISKKQPHHFAMSEEGLKLTLHKKEIKVKRDFWAVKTTEAFIHTMFYIMTGEKEQPKMIYFWDYSSGEEDDDSIDFIKAYPMAVPKIQSDIEKGANADAFLEVAKSLYGTDILLQFNRLKGDNEEGELAELNKPENEIWSDLARSIAGMSKSEKLEEAQIKPVDAIRARYVALMGALKGLKKPPVQIIHEEEHHEDEHHEEK